MAGRNEPAAADAADDDDEPHVENGTGDVVGNPITSVTTFFLQRQEERAFFLFVVIEEAFPSLSHD